MQDFFMTRRPGSDHEGQKTRKNEKIVLKVRLKQLVMTAGEFRIRKNYACI
jgi:hypothetical protein